MDQEERLIDLIICTGNKGKSKCKACLTDISDRAPRVCTVTQAKTRNGFSDPGWDAAYLCAKCIQNHYQAGGYTGATIRYTSTVPKVYHKNCHSVLSTLGTVAVGNSAQFDLSNQGHKYDNLECFIVQFSENSDLDDDEIEVEPTRNVHEVIGDKFAAAQAGGNIESVESSSDEEEDDEIEVLPLPPSTAAPTMATMATMATAPAVPLPIIPLPPPPKKQLTSPLPPKPNDNNVIDLLSDSEEEEEEFMTTTTTTRITTKKIGGAETTSTTTTTTKIVKGQNLTPPASPNKRKGPPIKAPGFKSDPTPPPSPSPAKKTKVAGRQLNEMTYYDVSFNNKEHAKSLGCWWDNDARAWYIRPGNPNQNKKMRETYNQKSKQFHDTNLKKYSDPTDNICDCGESWGEYEFWTCGCG